MNLTFSAPDEVFISSVIIDGMTQSDSETKFTGRPADENASNQVVADRGGYLRDKANGWQTHEFGFVTSDVTDLSNFEKIQLFSRVVHKAQSSKKEIEFLFLVHKTVFGIYWRNKARSFG